MEIWHSFLRILDTSVTTPKAYGAFHIAFIALSLICAGVLCFCYKKGIITNVRKVVFIVAIIVLILEILKQINYSFDPKNNFVFDYQWYVFPWQFCSTPAYAGLLAGIIKKGRVHNALCAFLATFGLFAGLCVMVLPGDVFTNTLFIDIQTMVCHGSMVTIGIFLFYTSYVKLEIKTILKAVPVFSVAVGIAVVLNEIAFRTGLLETDTFNMFFVSPYCEPTLIVYSSVQKVVPFPWCLIIYILVFTLASSAVLILAMGISAIGKHIKKQINRKKSAA